MKKNFRYTLYSVAFALCGMATGCDSLDIDNLSSFNEETVWANADLTTAYVNNLYPSIFGSGWSSSYDNNSEQVTGMPWYLGTITETGGTMKVWSYTTIRKVNEAIKQLEASTLLEDAVKKQMLGECHFMRAYLYYEMVRCHGGVPYIKIPQDKDADDLYVKRNSTKECFQFMQEDMEVAIANLPARHVPGSDTYGRIDGCFARAFLAKILLLKCSPQFNPSNQWDNAYWQETYSAAKNAYEFCVANGLKLKQTSDYNNIWLDESGEECVFPIILEYPNKSSSVEGNKRPLSYSRATPSSNPTWQFVMSFPMLDGKAYDDPTGKYYVGTEEDLMQSFWKNRDPRFEAVVLHCGELYPVAGSVAGNRFYNVLGISTKDDAYGTNPNAGATASNNDSYSGFYNFKCSDLSLTQASIYNYDIDYQLMRLPEVMFIYAEAANETGHGEEAVEMLRQIRERAGIERGDGNYGLSVASREEIRAAILAERNIELCFEGHRFWDLRRTRNMMQLDGHMKYGLEAIAINEDGTDMDIKMARERIGANELTPENFRYVKHRVPFTPTMEHEFVIEESFYFFPIQKSKLQENENLEQNNNWGGTFNPTME